MTNEKFATWFRERISEADAAYDLACRRYTAAAIHGIHSGEGDDIETRLLVAAAAEARVSALVEVSVAWEAGKLSPPNEAEAPRDVLKKGDQ